MKQRKFKAGQGKFLDLETNKIVGESHGPYAVSLAPSLIMSEVTLDDGSMAVFLPNDWNDRG